MESALTKVHASIDFGKLTADKIEVVDQIGSCPLSCCDAIELMQQKDVMCIGLSISRPEAAISDPTRLKIKEVYPAYMSFESFLESSIYNLKLNQDAHGGFNVKEEGSLAIGAGQ